MHKNIFVVIILFFTVVSKAQVISGSWSGSLKVPGAELKLVFNIEETASGLAATMDSPDQGAYGIPATSVNYQNDNLEIAVANAVIVYKGTMNAAKDRIEGTFNQAGQSFPLVLTQGKSESPKRPQEPQGALPYQSEDVIFENTEDNFSLHGTLTFPEKTGNFPAVVLINGSGPQNRNSEVFGHKPFLVLADYLTQNGIAVLRFDERGVAQSEGNYQNATFDDLASDVQAAVEYLKSRKEIDGDEIGLIGHSEGGIIAPMVANKFDDVDFLVLLASPTLPGKELMLLQKRKIEEQLRANETAIEKSQEIFSGAYDIILDSEENVAVLHERLKTYFYNQFGGALPEAKIKQLVEQITRPLMINLLKYDPVVSLKELEQPVLALFGTNDLQVPSEENSAAMQQVFENVEKQNFSIEELDDLNHLFQESETGLPNEYTQIEQTFSPAALQIVAEWINEQTQGS